MSTEQESVNLVAEAKWSKDPTRLHTIADRLQELGDWPDAAMVRAKAVRLQHEAQAVRV